MKTTDIEEIYQAALQIILISKPAIYDEVEFGSLANVLTNIYLMNDQSKEVSNRLLGFGTIIATRTQVSIILDTGRASHYGNSEPLCYYDDLDADLTNILSIIDLTYQRIIEQ